MTRGPTTEFAVSRFRVQHSLVLAAVLTAIGIFLLFASGELAEAPWIAAANFLAAGGIAGYALLAARRGAVKLRIGPEGVWYDEWRVTVPWSAIAGVSLSGGRMQSFVKLDLIDPDGFLRGLPESLGEALRGSRLFKESELRIPHEAVEARAEQILERIRDGLVCYRSQE